MGIWPAMFRSQWDREQNFSCHLLLSRDLGFLKIEEYAELDKNVGRILRMLSAFSAKVRKQSIVERI